MRRRRGVLAAGAVLVAVLLAAVFPTRTYLAQRRDLDAAERRLSVLRRENEELAARAQRLTTEAEIERLAREQYQLVRPGEEAYAILPPPEPPPPARPQRDERKPGFWFRLWDGLTFWS